MTITQRTTCPTGQVRMDAVIENGLFIGGCDCRCDPEVYDPSSPKYCSTTINFDPRTLEGDCSCIPATMAGDPIATAIPGTVQCEGLQEMNTVSGKCECPLQNANGAYYPQCTPPLVSDPMTCDCVLSATTTPAPNRYINASISITN